MLLAWLEQGEYILRHLALSEVMNHLTVGSLTLSFALFFF